MYTCFHSVLLFIKPILKPCILFSERGQINEEPACPPKLVERRGKCTKGYMRIPNAFLTNPGSKIQGFKIGFRSLPLILIAEIKVIIPQAQAKMH